MSPAPLGRPSSDEQRIRLKAAFRMLLRAVGGQESAAMVTRVSQQTLSRYQVITESIAVDQNYPPLDVMLDLLLDARKAGPDVFRIAMEPLRVIADEVGCVVSDKAPAASVNNVISLVGGIAKATGDLTHETLRASADGEFDTDEKRRLLQLVRDEEERLATLRRALESNAA